MGTTTAELTTTRRVLLLHALLLMVVLALAALVVDPSTSFSADEGAAIAQVGALRDGSWVIPNPVPALDDEGRWFPLELGTIAEGGVAPYVKHPLYPILLVPFAALAGTPGMVAASILGTVVAAVGAGVLAARRRPSFAVPALWLTGVGSPLLFDSFLVIAHTLAAATTAWAAVCLLRALRPGRAWAIALAGSAVLVATGALLRSEALFVGPALAVGALAAGTAVPLRRRMFAGVVVGLAAVSAYLLDGRLSRLVLGETGSEPFSIASSGGWLQGRIAGFLNTWLLPASDGLGLGSGLLLGAVVVLGLLGFLVSRPAVDEPGVRFLAVVAVVLAVAGGIMAPDEVVRGLLVAFPLLLWLPPWSRQLLAEPLHRVLLATSAALALAVLATQYPQGGTAEWGGRYFAVALPLVVPAIVDAVHRARLALDGTTVKAVTGAVVAVTVVLAALSVSAMRAGHERTAGVIDGTMDAVAMRASEPQPVIVATNGLIPRLAWDHLDDARWLLVPPDELPELFAVAGSASVDQVFVVTLSSLSEHVDDLGAYSVVDAVGAWGPWTVTELCRRC